MVSAVVKPGNTPYQSHVSKLYAAQAHELALNQSIGTLLDSLDDKDANLSDFLQLFHELMQVRVDPPLESVWAYSALTYRGIVSPESSFLDRVSSVKDLFQLISACSAPCAGAKTIALLAPVVFKAHGLVAELWERWSGSKRERKMLREVRSLVDVILGYVGVCCSRNSSDASCSSRLIRPLEDLVSLWIEKVNGRVKGGLQLFFPLVSEKILDGLNDGSCEVGELVGVVVAQLFLLRLCLIFRNGATSAELERELKDWAIASLTGLYNVYLFETLLQMLLEPVLPVTSLLNSEDELVLRKALYDALILVDYSFLDLESASQHLRVHLKNIALMSLIVAFEAVELFRRESDQSKAISLSSAFSGSRLPSQLFSIISRSFELKQNTPTGSSPKAFLKWILDLEQQGLQIVAENFSRFRHKLSDLSMLKDRYLKDDDDNDDVEFCIDKLGKKETEDEDELLHSMSNAFMAAAHKMTTTETKQDRKRKIDSDCGRKKRHTTLSDYCIDDGDCSEYISACSDVENRSESSEEDMEEDER